MDSINLIKKNPQIIELFNTQYPDLKFEHIDDDLAVEILESILVTPINNICINNTENIIDKNYDLADENIPEMLMPSNLIILNGKINNCPIKILVDTGATTNCIYKSKILEAKLDEIVDKEITSVMSGIHGDEKTYGKIWYTEIELELNHQDKNKSTVMIGLNLAVVNDENIKTKASFDIILGLSFLKSYKANLDFFSNTITLNRDIKIKFN